MGFHIFSGLATTPPDTTSKTDLPGWHNDSSLYMPHRSSTLLGGACSTRSQFREGISAVATTTTSAASPGARVDGFPSEPSEASAKKRESLVGSIRADGLARSKIKKRSLLRAIRRAQEGQDSYYKGKRLTCDPQYNYTKMATTPASPAPRLHILSWNCSGLTQVLFEELKLHLRLHPCIQVVCLQETHRAFLNEWTADGWTFIHSAAAKAHQGGVLLGFRDTFCSKESLRWQEVHPGRMLHVRCFAQDQHLDFIGLYQHVLPFDSKELEKALVKRRQLWGKLDSLLQSFPLRSSVVVAGDFNSNLCSNGSCIGHSVLHNSAKKSVIEERLWLSGMLASHQLAALNSWSRKLPTYVHPSGSSQIDWILVRTALADRQAKQCVPKEAPLAGWRSSGHKMLQATVPLRWRPWKAAQQRERRSTHSSAAASGHNPQLQEVVQHVRDHVVPARQGVVRPGFVGADGEILRFWEARRLLATQSTRSMRDIFARMRLVLQLQRRRREMQAAIRFHKRKQLLDTLSLAEHSSRIGDSRSLYQCVRWLAPRGTRSTIRLRDAEGRLMHPKQECRMLAEYATELFQAKRVLDVPDIQLQPLDPAVFHPDQWFCAISSLRIGKAVPIGMPTVQQWKDCNASAASELSQIAIQSLCCDKPSIPQEWADVQLAWLAKAGKTPSRPQNLRSIGLMSVDCKAFLIVLRGAIAPYIEDTMRQHPQYAYRKGASTSDALMRAAGHCSSVRKLLQRHRSDHTAKILGEATVPLVGGLMCGIDLQKAFDALPHSEIHSGLLDAGVPDALAAAVVQVHLQTKCFVRHGGTEGVVSMTRGLRQGCPIAPIVYAAWSCRLCRLLDRRIVVSWSAEHCTLFADDIFSCWVLHTVKDFKDAVRELRSLIEALHALGMSVNFQKSIVVLRLCGKAVAALSKSYLVWRNGAQHLRLRCADCDMYIPCSTSMPYLGATLSYDNFELQTYKTRAQQAHARFQELRRVLRTNGAVACRHRVRIYKATVWPTLWYALSSVGLTVDVLKGVGSLLAGHLRKVLRVHEEGISNRAVLQRAGIDPRGFFLSQVKSKGESILHDSRRADHIKVQESQHCYHVYQRMLGFEDTPAMSTLTRVAKVDAVAVDCPCCGISFDSQASLNMHIQRRHPQLNVSARLAFRRDQHALHGLPICRFCQARLHDWRSLEKHITEGTCSRIKHFVASGHDESSMLCQVRTEEQKNPPAAPAKAIAQDQLDIDISAALQVEPATLRQQGGKLKVLATHCSLCRQLIPDSSKIKVHWQRSHPQEWASASADAIAGSKSLCSAFSSPCTFCGSKARSTRDHAGKCSAVFQLLATRRWQSGGHTLPAPGRGPSLKQSQQEPQYKQHDLAKTPLGRYFRSASTTEVQAGHGMPGAASVPSLDTHRPGRNLPNTAAPGSAPLPVQWLCRLILGNRHNHCYMNASVYAVLHTMQAAGVTSRALLSLRELCQGFVRRSEVLHLATQLIVRTILRRWTFDTRQHDAAEFTATLLDGLALSHVHWEARYPDEEGMQILHTGGAPISLRLRPTSCTLQALVDDWHHQICVHAFTRLEGPVLLHLARNADAVKQEAPVHISQFIWIPVFLHGIHVEWRSCQVRAVVEHHGESVVSGHYRAVLKTASGWIHTDDHAAPSSVLWTAERESLMYLAWLIPAQSDESRPRRDC